MKKLIIITLASLSLLSCTDEKKYYYPCVQHKNGETVSLYFMLNSVLKDTTIYKDIHYDGINLTFKILDRNFLYKVSKCSDTYKGNILPESSIIVYR